MNTAYLYLAVLLISTSSLLVQTQDASSLGTPFSCPAEPIGPDCSCDDFGSKIEMHCPDMDPSLYVYVQNQAQVLLKCTDPESYDLKSVRNLDFGNASLLKVDDCSLEEDQPILKSFEFLGVTNLKSLLYVNRNNAVDYNARYFEKLDQLENLTLSRGVASIGGDTFSEVRNLKRLIIEHNRLELRAGTFEVLGNLTYLGLAYNQINNVEPGLFNGLESLEVLSLAFNKIKNLGAESFNGLNTLRYLNLRGNSIESFDVATFATLPELTRLELALNPFERLPKGLFAENRKLTTLILMHNKKLVELPEELLVNLPLLNIVNLSHNGIRFLTESLFSGSSGITELNLSYNKLEKLPNRLLSDQQQLQTLNLDHNRLESIPEHIFSRNNELRTLDLSNNDLSSLPEKTFASLRNLKELHLENNKLQTVAQSIFAGSRNLEEIYMQNNQLSWHANSFKNIELSTAENDNTPFQYLEKLRVLQLRNNSITTIFVDWYLNNLDLQYLDLSFNQLPELSYIDLQFQLNISLNLSNNQISKILLGEQNQSPHQKIKVDLNNNPLNCDCDVLEFVQFVQSKADQPLQFSIEKLRCSEPQNLLEVPVNQVQTKELVCDLETDCPNVCQCAKRPLDRTIVVNCSGRGLSQIPELPKPSDIEGYAALELHVENNLLNALPLITQTGYSEVTQLYAQNNSIRELGSQNIPASLRLLDLSNNQLPTINDSTLEALNRSDHLETLRLSQNQWLCDCPSARFLIYVQQSSRLISDMSGMLCHPSGRSLDSITVNELCFEDYSAIIALCIVVAILALLVALISVLFFNYQTEVKVWLFTHNLFLSFITEEELDKDKLYDAFISYSHLDEDFITDELIPKLENDPMNFKTCWHVRDFMPGEMIMSQIIKSIEASRRTVIVLSKNFLESSWAKEEFRQAHVQSMEDNRVRVIVVIYEDIGDIESLDSELKAYLKTNTYVKWGDPWFWQKLRYAMPHPIKVKGIKSAVSEIHLQQVMTMKETPTAV